MADVTEAEVEAAARVIYEHLRIGPRPFSEPNLRIYRNAARAALEAAAAVREGKG